MRTIWLVLAGLAVPAAAGAQDAALVARGENVYVAQKCSVCHSVAGKGNQKGPLDDVGVRLSAEEIRLWMVDPVTMTAKTKAVRKPPMKAYAHIPKEELDALVAYMQSLKKK